MNDEKPKTEEAKWISDTEAAELLGVTVYSIHRKHQRGQLRARYGASPTGGQYDTPFEVDATSITPSNRTNARSMPAAGSTPQKRTTTNPLNPFGTNVPLEARWLKGQDNSDFLACPLCGFTTAIVAEWRRHTYRKGSHEPLVSFERGASLNEGYVKTKDGIYTFPLAKKRLHKHLVPLNLTGAQLPATVQCPNQKCKRLITIRLHPLSK